jgi:hypothetical protein
LADGCRETGPWTRHRLAPAARAADTAWLRFGARLAELVRLAIEPTWLQAGACSTGPHEAIAWTEMSRGLLLHWVRLRPAGEAAGAATAGAGSATSGDRVVAAYRVLAPTEWNFHADGALAQWLAGRGAPAPDAAAARLAVTALDPCVAFTVGPAVGDATAAGR